MAEMTSRERFLRMYDHREADRVPIIDFPWDAARRAVAAEKKELNDPRAAGVEYQGPDMRGGRRWTR